MHSDLIARIESGEGDERELDAEIGRVVFGPDAVRNTTFGWPHGTIIVPYSRGWMELPHYMTSVNDAMKLLPEGWHISEMRFDPIRLIWTVTVAEYPSDAQIEAFMRGETYAVRSERAEHADLPRTIVAACLRVMGDG
jgi:hypothetical protein